MAEFKALLLVSGGSVVAAAARYAVAWLNARTARLDNTDASD